MSSHLDECKDFVDHAVSNKSSFNCNLTAGQTHLIGTISAKRIALLGKLYNRNLSEILPNVGFQLTSEVCASLDLLSTKGTSGVVKYWVDPERHIALIFIKLDESGKEIRTGRYGPLANGSLWPEMGFFMQKTERRMELRW
ncbi:hypothetical protein DM02DRAFT_658875 [Periconia macrospinosa]|uniref:Uncharacterized protein n=1 Tax=Periconia macrospinosa TaxID=97972 RepID=A0A2V1DF92_9PLEO|nr:hypothetical protein DM02DRAFT_658875 [Periconia macrospinosa]